jgi:hypothetical protein
VLGWHEKDEENPRKAKKSMLAMSHRHVAPHLLKLDIVLLKRIVGTVTSLINVVEGDLGGTHGVSLISAGKVNHPRDLKIKQAFGSNRDLGIDCFPKNSLGPSVYPTGVGQGGGKDGQ